MPRVLRWDNLLLAYCRAEKGLRRKQEARLYASRLNRNLRITGVHIVTHSSQPFVNPPGEPTDGRSAGENSQA